MCRLFIANQKDFYEYDKAYGILKLMNYLEMRCGGHGNGFALIHNGKIIAVKKAVKLTNEEIYREIKGIKKWDYVIYHTRITSSGTTCDAGCHPFTSKDGHNALAMNGTISALSGFASLLSSVDSELIFKMIKDITPKETVQILSKLHVIFIGLASGLPYAVKGSGDLCKWKKSTFHASEFPKDVRNITELDGGYIWLDGKVVQKKAPEKSQTYRYSPYSYYKDAYDDYEYSGYGSGYGDADAYDEGYAEGYTAAYEELGATISDRDDAAYEYDYADHDEGALNRQQQLIYNALMRR